MFSVRCELNICKLFRLPYHGSGGYWTALTVEARVLSQASLVDTVSLGQKSLPVLRYSFVSILTKLLYTFINLDTSFTTRTSEQSLGSLKQSIAVFDIEIDRMQRAFTLFSFKASVCSGLHICVIGSTDVQGVQVYTFCAV